MNGPRPPEQDQPVYWFILLECAYLRLDLGGILRARQELARLGYLVDRRSLPPPHRPDGEKGGRHAS